LAAIPIRRYSPKPVRLDRFANIGFFLVFGVFLSPVLSSFLDAAFVRLNGFGEVGYWTVWQTRLFSNVLAVATVVPVILAWNSISIARLRSAFTRRYLEIILLVLSLVVVSVVVFRSEVVGPDTRPALLYAPLPLLLWAAVRFGPIGASTSLLVVVVYAIWCAVNGYGPFMSTSARENALSIQLLFTTVSITLISLTAVLEERQAAQSSARQKSEQLQLAFDAAQLGSWDWQMSDAATWLAAARRVLGNPAADAVISFDGFSGPIHPADLPSVSGAVARSAERGAPLSVEFRVVVEGGIRWMLAKGRVLVDDGGRPVRMIGITADITERKRADQSLHLIAAGAPINEILTSVASLVEAESPGMYCLILLLEPDGVHARKAAAPSLPESVIEALDGLAIGPNAGACGTAMYRQETVVCVDLWTDPLWVQWREIAVQHGLRACWSTPIISELGSVLGSFGVFYRVTRGPTPAEVRLVEISVELAAIALDRKRVQAEAHEQRRALAHLSRVSMLGEFSGAIAHELTQPLTAILSNAQAAQRLLSRNPPEWIAIQEILADIVAADQRATEVIRRLRAMLIEGQAQLTALDLNEVTAETLKLARSDLAAREIAVATEMQPDLPSVLGDRIQIQQVVLNLILNGSDAMSTVAPAERTLTIITRESPHNGAVELSICDRGPGIDQSLIDRIFDPFYTSKEHGMGLGLSICRSIVLAHHGRIWAVNNEDRGATFSFMLPAAHQNDSQSTHLRVVASTAA
ncbi:MAG TPA: ATP-binding protein, partial [Longimicrobiales bacterium]|nr:ATP-binding protein [Longimicrobiales bacterium]